jgi:hypothetical protein
MENDDQRLIDSRLAGCDGGVVTPTWPVTTRNTEVESLLSEHSPTPFLWSHARFQVKWLVCATVLPFSEYFYDFSAAIYTVYTSPNHPSVPNHLPTLIVTPHGMLQSRFFDYTVHSDTLLDPQANPRISSTRIFIPTLYAPVSKNTKLDLTTQLPNRTRRTTCSHHLHKVISVLPSSSRLAAPARASPPLRILVILLVVHESFAVKHPETSNGPSPTPVSFHPFTSSLSPLRIPQIFLCSKSPSRTQMLRSGVCSILPMRVTTSHPSGLNSERSRRIHLQPMELEAAELGSVLLGELPRKRQYGRLLAKATRIVWNGWSCAQLSTFLSESPSPRF